MLHKPYATCAHTSHCCTTLLQQNSTVFTCSCCSTVGNVVLQWCIQERPGHVRLSSGSGNIKFSLIFIVCHDLVTYVAKPSHFSHFPTQENKIYCYYCANRWNIKTGMTWWQSHCPMKELRILANVSRCFKNCLAEVIQSVTNNSNLLTYKLNNSLLWPLCWNWRQVLINHSWYVKGKLLVVVTILYWVAMFLSEKLINESSNQL